MPARTRLAAVALAIAIAATFAVFLSTSAPAVTTTAGLASPSVLVDAPEFSGIGNWINSAPLSMGSLRGKVVLVDFWTFDCVNCINTLPHIKEWNARYGDKGLVVVGVHTPEYGFERDIGNLKKAVSRYEITYPVAQDNQYATWNAYRNQDWPALYLVNKQGKLSYSHFGEGDYKDTEEQIRRLLAENG